MKKEEPTNSRRIWTSIFIIFSLFIVGSIFAAIIGTDTEDITANTAIIKIIGPISGDSDGSMLSDGGASSTDIVEQLERARDDDAIEAVILEINSPGGSAVASDEIGQAVKDVRAQNKTVVAWIREEGASGGYWIASTSDHIVANRMSITGSIGVISSYLEFDRFLEHWNITYNRLTAGARKDVGDPFTNLSADNRAFLQAKLDRVHGFFISEVARNRNMTYEEVAQLADGSFYLGVEAKEVGLIDELGGKNEAITYIEDTRGITVDATVFEPESSFFDELLGVFGKQPQPRVMDYVPKGAQDNAPVPMLK